jgi:MoxR-like ATPase
VYVDPLVADYAVTLTFATRQPDRCGLPALRPYVEYGASPRGSIYLLHTARARALLHGRRYVLPQDVQDLAPDVLRHRLVLSYQALAEEVSADDILSKILAAVPAPQIELAQEDAAS